MQPQMVFAFPFDVDAHTAIMAVAAHFGAAVSINGAAPNVPAHIKQAVEAIGVRLIDNPENGVEQSAAIAFGGLVNGGNVNAASSADAAPSPTAPVANPVISQTSAQGLSAPVVPPAPPVVAPTANAAPSSPANVDKDGLPHDPRIHSTPATLTDKGVWRKKRGVTADQVASVTSELKAIAAIPAAPVVGTGTGAPDKKAALAYAHSKAIEICGAQPISDAVLNDLLNGKPTQMTVAEGDWFHAYFACRNKHYTEYMAGNVGVPAAPASLPQSGNVPANVPAAPLSASSPTVAVTPPPAPVAPPSHDATGLPFDARINVTPATLDGSGVFVQRMDVTPEYKLQVIAELRGNGAAQVSTAPATPVISAPVAPPPPPVPGVTAEQAGTSFALMMRWIVQNKLASRLTDAQVAEVCASFGFVDPATGTGSVALAASRNDYWPAIVATLQAYGAL